MRPTSKAWPAPLRRERWGALAAVAALGLADGPARAQPAPVLAGVWDVQTLVSFERLPTAPSSLERPASQSRSYRICIGAERARAPMLPPRLPPAAELVFDGQSYTGFFDQSATAAVQVEIGFRRLSATAFEGSHDTTGPGLVARTQYFARYGGPNCGATEPGWPADSGLP